MVIIAKSTLTDYAAEHTDVAEALNNWYLLTKESNWSNFSEMKRTFNSVDAVGNDRYVFNIKGNNYRLIVLIVFKARTVFILWFDTHAEYNKVNKHTGAKNVTFDK